MKRASVRGRLGESQRKEADAVEDVDDVCLCRGRYGGRGRECGVDGRYVRVDNSTSSQRFNAQIGVEVDIEVGTTEPTAHTGVMTNRLVLVLGVSRNGGVLRRNKIEMKV